MFQFPRFPSYTYVFSIWYTVLHRMCFHIQKSADRGLFAAPRSLSQLVTSFFGSWCQGILLVLLFAWTSFVFRISFNMRRSLSSLFKNCWVHLNSFWFLISPSFHNYLCFDFSKIVFLPLIQTLLGKTKLISIYVFFPVRYQFFRINSLLFLFFVFSLICFFFIRFSMNIF